MAKKSASKAEGVKVSVRLQLYIEGAGSGLVIAGPRLLKGEAPNITFNFPSTAPDEAEKNRKALENYLRA